MAVIVDGFDLAVLLHDLNIQNYSSYTGYWSWNMPRPDLAAALCSVGISTSSRPTSSAHIIAKINFSNPIFAMDDNQTFSQLDEWVFTTGNSNEIKSCVVMEQGSSPSRIFLGFNLSEADGDGEFWIDDVNPGNGQTVKLDGLKFRIPIMAPR